MKTAVAIVLVLCALLIQPPPSMAQAPLPVVAVEAFGCVLCETGQIAAFRVTIANPDGGPKAVHLLTQMELPSGDIATIVDGLVALPTRVTQVLLFSRPVTAADPVGTYWLDAAIFDGDEEFLDAYSLRADKLSE